ncbi:MAG TPA: anthranilate phosphoribosyltransferase [Rhodospirillaceae bacterium]|nr:anthranilate phosphoribosyltransferase [Rhodospirillaceae bacterium]MBL25413.1 anthranilate phosphoribosyltransferase [Rhodospirillaceae bacterium]HAA91910.1 anthranilate phosphoribosyltransferase [Rhodospirillaceae bacterium]HAT36069.1 anthranilate phosphoribosyltransferase [Rhodospirillaceae bacterium]
MSDASLKPFIAKTAENAALSQQEASEAFDIMMSGSATPAQIGAFLMALRLRGETVAEITGAAEAMRSKMTNVVAPADAMDIVGTGGDAHGTHNISTATALVVAGAGVPVAKHGNRAFSSLSGSADVLSALGVDLEATQSQVEKSIAEAGIGFLMAPLYHGAMRHVGPSRAEMGIRTVFNILGPMCNPASVKFLLVGTYDAKWLTPMAETLAGLGVERAWIVHGSDGMDELTTTGPSHVAKLEGGNVTVSEINPQDAGLSSARLEDLKGGSPEENAAAIRELLDGAEGAFRDIVVYNAAAALNVAGKADTLTAGAELAIEAIASGAAKSALAGLLSHTGSK